jgi:short-subunit dehydrogenase
MNPKPGTQTKLLKKWAGATASPVFVITGASKGIGAELARQLARRGARLVRAARDTQARERVADEGREAGGSAITVDADVSKERDCQAIMAGAALAFGRVDVLVNNAGATMWARFDEVLDLSVFERLMQVNYLGAVYCTSHALPLLAESGGLIVGVASLTALAGVPTRTGYAAAKHAMRGFFDSLRIELAGSGVDVTMVYPGFVATGIRENATGPDGAPVMVSPVKESEVMRVEDCAARIVRAIERREREVVMTARGRIALWLKLVAPGLVDRMARRAIERGR